MSEQACSEYKSSLEDLTFNSKPLINVLTMLAEDGIAFAPQIVQVIEAHLRKAKVEHKLPVIYLIDSIIKNVGKQYLHLFRQNIVSNFCSVFEKGDEKVRMMLFKVRQTWSEIFTAQKLHAIDTRVHQLDPAWPVVEPEVVRPSIHVNPKFLEQPSKKEGTGGGSSTKQKAASQQASAEAKRQAVIEAQMKEKLKEKQQELLRLQQQKLVLELSQTKARLKEQTRQLQQVQSQQLFSNNPSSPAVSVPPVTTNIANQSSIQGNAQSRDPRLNGKVGANRDPRIYSKLSTPIVVTPKVSNLNVKAEVASSVKGNPATKVAVSNNFPVDKSRQLKTSNSFRNLSRDASITIPPAAGGVNATFSSTRGSDTKQTKSKFKESSPNAKRSAQPQKTLAKIPKSSEHKTESKTSSKGRKSKSSSVFSQKKSRSNSPVKKRDSSPNKKTESMKIEKNLDVDLRNSPKGSGKRAVVNDSIDISEPLAKMPKESVIDDLFGGEDKDYRPQLTQRDLQLADNPTNKREWAKYKVSHPDEYQSPRRPVHHRTEEQFGFGKEDTDLRYSSENDEKEDKPRSRNRLESTVQMTVMVKNRDAILKQAEQQLRLGQINEKLHGELLENLGKVVQFQDERKRQLRYKSQNMSRMKRIMIDNKMREIKFENGRCIVVMDNHIDHLIRFKGHGRNVIINNQEFFLDFNGEERYANIDGKEHCFKFGGPTRELLVDNIPYEGRFGANPIWVKIDGQVYRAQLQGPSPEVEVLPLENTESLMNNRNRNYRSERLNNEFENLGNQQNNNERQFEDYPQSRKFRSRGNWKSGSPPMTRNRVNMGKKFLPNNNQQPSREWPSDRNEARGDNQRWKRNVLSQDEGLRNENTRYNSPPRGGPANRFDEQPRKLPLLPNPDQVAELNLERNSNQLNQNQFQQHGHVRGSRQFPTYNRIRMDKGSNEFIRPDVPSHALGSNPQENTLKMHRPSLIPENKMPILKPPFPLLPPPPPFFNPGMVPINPVPIRPPIELQNQSPNLPPPTLNAFNTRLDITSLFDKLVTTGIILKSETGAGYNVGSKNVEPKKDEVPEKQKIEKEPEVKPPEIELTLASLRQSHTGVLEALYAGTKCESCGVRFTPENMDKYSSHLDWHFRANRREKDSAKKAHSRKWYFDVEDWIQFEEIEDADERAQNYFDALAVAEEQSAKSTELHEVPTVPASEDEHENMCSVCKEQFEVFWDENDESWRLKEAIEVDGKIYHPSCYEDIQKREQEFLKVETPTDSSILPGLDLLKSEDVEMKDVDMSIVKDEPVKSQEKEEEKKSSQNSNQNEKDDHDDDESSLKIDIKQEPVEEAQPENIEETVIIEPLLVEGVSDEDPSTSSGIDGENNTDPLTPSLDEKSEEFSRPEPERIRIIPQTGPSTISLNLCKSTVDSGLCDSNKNTVPAKEAPETSQSESEEELQLPPPDPRFAVQQPVMRGTELSGLCSIM